MQRDELKHYGIPGMKWGVRKAVSVGKRVGSALGKAALSSIKSLASKGMAKAKSYLDNSRFASKKVKAARAAQQEAEFWVRRKLQRDRENEIARQRAREEQRRDDENFRRSTQERYAYEEQVRERNRKLFGE